MSDKKAEAFNAFTADWKNRIETLIKTVILLSGGVMSITISAYIKSAGSKQFAIPEAEASIIQYSWYLLASSLVASLLTFFILVISGAIVLSKWEKIVSISQDNAVIIDSPRWLHIIAWLLAIFSVISCIVGLVFMAHGATYLLAKSSL